MSNEKQDGQFSLSSFEQDIAKGFHPLTGWILVRKAKQENGARFSPLGWADKDRSKATVSGKVLAISKTPMGFRINLDGGQVDVVNGDLIEYAVGDVISFDPTGHKYLPGDYCKVGLMWVPVTRVVGICETMVASQFEWSGDSKVAEAAKKARESADEAAKKAKEKADEKAKKDAEKGEKKADDKKADDKKVEPPKEKTEAEKKAEQDAEAAKKLQEEQTKKELEAKAHEEKAANERAEAEKLQRLAAEQEAQAKAATEAARRAEQERLSKEREEAEAALKAARQAELEMMASWTDDDVQGMLQSESHLKHPERKPAAVSDKTWGQWKKAQRDAESKKG